MVDRRKVAAGLAWQPVVMWSAGGVFGLTAVVLLIGQQKWVGVIAFALVVGYCCVRAPMSAKRARQLIADFPAEQRNTTSLDGDVDSR